VCVSCGCALPATDHGDHRHITAADLRGAADAANTTVGCVAHNIESFAMHHPAEAQKAEGAMTEAADHVSVEAILKAQEDRRYLLTVVYSPHRMPLRGADHKIDLATPDVLEKACWVYAVKGLGTGMWHEDGHGDEAVCVENYIYRGPDWTVKDVAGGEQVIKAGTWLAGFVLSPGAWDLYKSGRIGGVSMQGAAGRKKASAEALALVGGSS